MSTYRTTVTGRWSGLTLIAEPVGYPVTVAQCKAHSNVINVTDDDDLFEIYLAAAVSLIDGKTGILGRALQEQTWEMTLDSFPCYGQGIEIPLPPLLSVESVVYDDLEGNEQTIDAANYTVDTASLPGRIQPAGTFQWPSSLADVNAIRIRFRAGYAEDSGPSSTVPASIKLALLIMVDDAYNNRGSVTAQQSNPVNIPTAAMALLNNFIIPAMA